MSSKREVGSNTGISATAGSAAGGKGIHEHGKKFTDVSLKNMEVFLEEFVEKLCENLYPIRQVEQFGDVEGVISNAMEEATRVHPELEWNEFRACVEKGVKDWNQKRVQ